MSKRRRRGQLRGKSAAIQNVKLRDISAAVSRYAQWIWRRLPGLRGRLTVTLLWTVLFVAVLAAAAVIGYKAINIAGVGPPGTDSGLFSAIGLHLLKGKVLYVDVWDHKPPGVYLLNEAALALGSMTISSIREMERWFAAVLAVTFPLIVLRAYRRLFLAAVGASLLLLHFYHGTVFEGGNLTEEYGAVFCLVGVLLISSPRAARLPLRCFFSGMVFALSVYTKEPFLLSSIAWFIYMLSVSDRKVRSGLCFVAGALTTAGLFTTYLIRTGAFSAWLDILSFNSNNVSDDPRTAGWRKLVANAVPAWKQLFCISATAQWTAVAGLASVFSRRFRRRSFGFPIAVTGAFLIEYAATSLSGRAYGHYYMQLAGSYVLLGVTGMAYLFHLSRKVRFAPVVVALVLVASVGLLDRRPVEEFASVIRENQPPAWHHLISEYMRSRSTPSDGLWVSSGHISTFYVDSGMLSPTKYLGAFSHVFIDTKGSTAGEKIASIKDRLTASAPRYVLVRDGDAWLLQHMKLTNWLSDNYRQTPLRMREVALYEAYPVRNGVADRVTTPTDLALLNSGFEEWPRDNMMPPVQWAYYAPGWGSAERVADSPYGASAVRLRKNSKASGWGGLIIQQLNSYDVLKAAGRTVRISLWEKGVANSVYASCAFDEGKETKYVRCPAPSQDTRWEHLDFDVAVPANVTGFRVILGSLTNSWVYFDEVKLECVQ